MLLMLALFATAGGSALPDPEDIPEADLELSLDQLEK